MRWQVNVATPGWQLKPAPQRLLHEPQYALVVKVAMQVPAHSVVPAGQTQRPRWHVNVGPHGGVHCWAEATASSASARASLGAFIAGLRAQWCRRDLR